MPQQFDVRSPEISHFWMFCSCTQSRRMRLIILPIFSILHLFEYKLWYNIPDHACQTGATWNFDVKLVEITFTVVESTEIDLFLKGIIQLCHQLKYNTDTFQNQEVALHKCYLVPVKSNKMTSLPVSGRSWCHSKIIKTYFLRSDFKNTKCFRERIKCFMVKKIDVVITSRQKNL